jgi:NADH dehydrogenase FAD-containing subunit
VFAVGGGYVGSEVAKLLDPNFRVTLIEPQDAMHHKIASLRAAVVPGWEERARIPLDRLLKFGTVVHKEVRSVASGSVTMQDGTTLNADFIILAHGMQATLFPAGPKHGVFDSKSAKEALKGTQKQFAAAKSILVVGGGPVGCELVGEIKAQYPDKTVTLVHSQDALLSNSSPPINPAATTKLLEMIRRKGIEVRLHAKVVGLPSTPDGDGFIVGNRTYSLSDGTTVNADLCVLAFTVPRTEGNLVAAVDQFNRVVVDEFLRVPSMNNVFCVGDANNHPETKMAFTGGAQGKHTVKNLELIATGRAAVPYVGIEGKNAQYGVMFVPVGPKKGVGAMDKQIFSSYMISLVKGKGLFSKRMFAEKNAVLPPLQT